ncbi:MAG TPA: MFS transporter [Pirellulales bacterium]|jgi:MFS family permease|nr:MFS transporter [Pirellulales bacterium]
MNAQSTRWYRELTRYHWFVLVVAALGWLFDTMDQQLFTMARGPAMQELLAPSPGVPADPKDVGYYGPLATMIFLLGWASGGLGFGVLGDRIGRAKTMLWTILVYSLCTGLSALSTSFWDFALYRFLTGLGVGGEFAVGVSLVAEVMPDHARPYALGLLQALSAVGNISAALISMALGSYESAGGLEGLTISGQPVHAWRIMFLVGTVPALLAILIRRRLKEPERWKAAAEKDGGRPRLGSYAELFGDPRWRRNTIVGVCLAFAGVVGLWGIGFFSVDLFRSVFTKQYQEAGLAPADVQAQVSFWISMTLILQNIGGFLGIWAYSRITPHIGRRPAFAIAFVLAMLSTGMVFGLMTDRSQIFWMIPMMGFCQLALFGGYAIYFPELFPTRLRSTGTSFCYNVGRFVAAGGPFIFGYLTSTVFADRPEPMRYAGVAMCGIFLLGLVVLPFAPETRGRPLPE